MGQKITGTIQDATEASVVWISMIIRATKQRLRVMVQESILRIYL